VEKRTNMWGGKKGGGKKELICGKERREVEKRSSVGRKVMRDVGRRTEEGLRKEKEEGVQERASTLGPTP